MGRLVEQAKANFLKEQQVELANDLKKFWRLVKSIVPSKKRKSSNISLVDRNNEEEELNVNEADTADYINSFFSGIGPKLAKNYNTP